jgi:NAD(P)-dependent dehydrogenase (short-subunit alcohol dehydrogenase family)
MAAENEAGRLAGQVAVITGGASGIGEATVRRFIGEGARVVIADLQDVEAATLAVELGDACARSVRCDVTDEADVAAAVDLAVSTWGRLDIMFNNAGIVGATGPIATTTADAWDTTMDILLRGVFLGIKHAARVMQPQGSGVIISTSSTAGILGGLGPHVYTAAKHGVIGLTKSVANELAADGIRVNAISPGGTVTPLVAAVAAGDPKSIDAVAKSMDERNPLGFATTANDIANAALYLASDDARSVTGHVMVVDSGVTTSGAAVNRFHLGEPTLHRHAGLRETQEGNHG